MVKLAATVFGLVIVLATVRDIVHELFDPEGMGSISRAVMGGVWRLVRAVARRRPRFVYHAGHTVLLSVAATWTVLLTLGWALVYWPQLPEGFHVDRALPPAAGDGFGTALYVSLTSLTTLGSSDLVPVATWLRLVTALESLLGAGMITAWISWVLSVYFQNRTAEISLSRQLPYVLALARAAGATSDEPALRHHGMLPRRAVESTLDDIGETFLGLERASPETIVRALAEDHLLDARASTSPPARGSR